MSPSKRRATAPPRRPNPRDREHLEQAALFEWAALAVGQYPELDMLFAVPNGGHRHPAVAARLKAEGVKASIPDIFLDVPRQGYHGLRIELKAPGGNGERRGELKQAQLDRLNAYAEHGYLAVARWGWEAARNTLIDYLEGKP